MKFRRKRGFYEKYVKRMLDIVCSVLVIVLFSWLYVGIALAVRVKMGKPVVFSQLRPGMIGNNGQEHIFKMYKFRTMTDARDGNGSLLPDYMRLSKFGYALRITSLDELPEVFNILCGDMSFIGPRPQLVRDMVFMSDRQRMRHTAKPGLSGLAQIMGRNAITWEEKLDWDLKYIENICFINDLRIVLLTVKKVFGKGESPDELNITDDYGDYLLKNGKITFKDYNALQIKAQKILERKLMNDSKRAN